MIPGETVLSRQALGLPEDPHTSDFEVMHSGAGYYVGTSHVSCGECESCKEEGLPKGFRQPGSRETEYFKTRAAAEFALKAFKETGKLVDARTSEFNEKGAKEIEIIELEKTEVE